MWQAVESGTVLIAEEDCPARKFADTEFYNDWASPTERHVGIKIDGCKLKILAIFVLQGKTEVQSKMVKVEPLKGVKKIFSQFL